jgi:beta-carotene ketolase (CrtW type)
MWAAGLMLAWALSLAWLLSLDLPRLTWWGVTLAVLLRTQLQTGLFIVAHDAMHRVLWPGRRLWNDRIGALALMLYAALRFRSCHRQHRRHHHQPASAADPDFPADRRAGPLPWYRQFMAGYLSPAQMARLLAIWAMLLLACGSSGTPCQAGLKLLLFCTLPLLLSSLQLFVFGTYLPHRGQRLPESRSHPDSLNLPPWLSLLACFHFGYHREHHDDPALPWFELPAARRRALALTLTGTLR